MADTDAPGCRSLQICLRERPHVIGKPRPPTTALLSLPHYCCPTRLRYLWGTCTYGNHSAHCCRDWLLGLTMIVCRRRKSRSRIGAWASSGTMCKTTRRLFWERLGVWMLILCAHTAPCLSPCVCSYCAYICACHRKVYMRAVYARTRRHSRFLPLGTRVDSEY